MRTVWQSLLWKEWHEHKWKVASITVVLVSFPLGNLLYEWGVTGVIDWIVPSLFLGSLFAGVFLGMGAAAGERDRDSARFLTTFPVATWKVALAKVIIGVFALLVPVVALVAPAMLLSSLFAHRATTEATYVLWVQPGDSIAGRLLWVGLTGWAASVGVFAWTACCGVRARTQIQVGAIALAVALLWSAVLFLSEIAGPSSLDALWYACPIGALFMRPAATPGHAYSGPGHAFTYYLEMAPMLLITMGLLMVYVVFYRPEASRQTSRTRAARQASGCLGPPRYSQWSALVWKQWREALPYLSIIFAVAVLNSVLVSAGWSLAKRGASFSTLLVRDFPNFALFWGFPAAVLIGVGTFVSDLRPPASSFWRSRPISPHLWFWTKMLVGVCGIVTLFWLPSFFVTRLDSSFSVVWPPFGLHLVVFAIAVACACLIRHVIYAGIIAVGLSAWLSMFWDGFEQHGFTPAAFVAFCVVVCVTATLIAWFSVSRDLGVDV